MDRFDIKYDDDQIEIYLETKNYKLKKIIRCNDNCFIENLDELEDIISKLETGNFVNIDLELSISTLTFIKSDTRILINYDDQTSEFSCSIPYEINIDKIIKMIKSIITILKKTI
jgi:hypothetical protein